MSHAEGKYVIGIEATKRLKRLDCACGCLMNSQLFHRFDKTQFIVFGTKKVYANITSNTTCNRNVFESKTNIA